MNMHLPAIYSQLGKNGKTLVKPCHWKTTHDWEWFFLHVDTNYKNGDDLRDGKHGKTF
jgi:hypothetical protein